VGAAAPSGEFLPKGSFFIRGKKNFVANNRVEVSVGLDPEGRVISGPESAVKMRAEAYVVLGPHREKASETAKRVLKDLETLSEGRVKNRPSLDDVMRTLPAGGSKVLRRHAAGGPLTSGEKDST
jgi:hypothetical protein